MKNLFLKNSSGKIFKVNHICMCSECQKRGMPELFLDDMNGDYADCIKVSDLFSEDWILSDDYYKLAKSD